MGLVVDMLFVLLVDRIKSFFSFKGDIGMFEKSDQHPDQNLWDFPMSRITMS